LSEAIVQVSATAARLHVGSGLEIVHPPRVVRVAFRMQLLKATSTTLQDRTVHGNVAGGGLDHVLPRPAVAVDVAPDPDLVVSPARKLALNSSTLIS
jgi:hypothetical protein